MAINSCVNIGLRIVNIGAMDLMEGKKHLVRPRQARRCARRASAHGLILRGVGCAQVMGILWQVIKMGLLDDIDLQHCPELYRLLSEGETIDQLLR